MGGLGCAVLSGDIPMIRRLVEAQASLTTRAREMFEVGIGPDFAPLHLAVVRSRHHTTILELLLELRSDPNMDAGASSCALGWCPSAHAVEVMVQARADVNRVCGPPFRITPLQTAAMTHQNKEVFARLLEKKADVHLLGQGLRSPILSMLATFCHLGYPDRLEVAKLLVEAGADPNARCKSAGMMYFLGLLARLRLQFRKPPVVAHIFANLDVASLGYAAIVGEARMVNLLLGVRADPWMKNNRGVMQMELARSQDVSQTIDAHIQRLQRDDESDSVASDLSQRRSTDGSELGLVIQVPF
ncbi:unnamed protein product [Symbiodinium pilosum]|uniref:Uncharacterized protein n=1 Tax=Symbiodinium pilosum TaxID=2952 RepID=A0A812KCS1_SYMPI|nr:unnamed protein product [Symbiodinium pilosum]